MTQLRSHRDALSNHFDKLFDGIGHRGSSFSDIDMVAHDGSTGRFLAIEIKREGEAKQSKGQYWMLRGLSGIRDHFTVWCVRWRLDGRYDWYDYRDTRTVLTLAAEDLRDKFRTWWDDSGAAQPVVNSHGAERDPGMVAFAEAIESGWKESA